MRPFGDAHRAHRRHCTAPGQRGVQPVERVGGQRVVDPPATAAGGDQAGFAQHLQVVAEQVRGDRDVLLQVAHTRAATAPAAPAPSTGSGPPTAASSATDVATPPDTSTTLASTMIEVSVRGHRMDRDQSPGRDKRLKR